MSMASRSPMPSTSGQAPLNLGTMSSKDFKRLLDTQSLVDVTLACDGGQISAHKVVLSACSSYINKILQNHPVAHPIIILPELNIRDIRILVNYMYTGELLTMNAPSHSLLKTAAVLNINSLNDFFNEPSPTSLTTSTTSITAATLQPAMNNKSSATNNNNIYNNNNNNNYNSIKNSNNYNNHTKQTRKYTYKNKQNSTNNISNNTIIANHGDDGPNSNNNNIAADNNINVKYLNINNLQEFLGSNYTNHLDDYGDDDIDDDLDDDDLDDDRDALMDESSDLHLDDDMMMLPQHDTTINSQFDGATNGAKNQAMKLVAAATANSLATDADKEIRCHLCDIKLSDVKCLYRHVLTRHLPDRWGYRCEFCDREFSRDDHLMRHYTTKHKGMEFNREKIRETRRHNREMAKNFHDRHAT